MKLNAEHNKIIHKTSLVDIYNNTIQSEQIIAIISFNIRHSCRLEPRQTTLHKLYILNII